MLPLKELNTFSDRASERIASSPSSATALAGVVAGLRRPKKAELTTPITRVVMATSLSTISATFLTEQSGDISSPSICWTAACRLGNESIPATICRSGADERLSCTAHARRTVRRSRSASQGLVR